MYNIYSNDNLLKLSITSIFSSLTYNHKKLRVKNSIYFTDQYYDSLENVVSKSLEDKDGIIVIFTHQSHKPINIGSRIILISLNTALSVICQFLASLVKRTLFSLQEVTLSKTEMLFLFLYYKNWSVAMMSRFLEIHEKTVTNTKHFLKKKYGIKDDIMFVTLSKSYSFYLNSFG
ncbi:hypothetical protein J2125_002275 [Erwinia toletana]|uniref:HTH luxR-type domain-containing protein n=1 Tax=Winslowiella toletana TaxID=92490 RepID=A0ABS4P8W8_9GAMM|nr:hypothetical protein [Winslowiella toletana]MBP2169083.1 hypothetical protein [Winslowiella toletana]